MAFLIVGKASPVYEFMMCGPREDLARQALFILHSALDMVELTVWANPSTCVTLAAGSAAARRCCADQQRRARVDRRGGARAPWRPRASGPRGLRAARPQHPTTRRRPASSAPRGPPARPPARCRYLRVVDRHENQLVSAYVTPGGYRFMLLHEGRNDEGIRGFFTEVHELLLKAALNPFHVPHGRIEAREFDGRVRSAARRHLGYKGD